MSRSSHVYQRRVYLGTHYSIRKFQFALTSRWRTKAQNKRWKSAYPLEELFHETFNPLKALQCQKLLEIFKKRGSFEKVLSGDWISSPRGVNPRRTVETFDPDFLRNEFDLSHRWRFWKLFKCIFYTYDLYTVNASHKPQSTSLMST